MTNAVYDSLIENLREIKIITEPTPNSFKQDRIQTGNGREFTIIQFVEKYFPTTYTLKKGPIYSLDNNSQEIDCVILAPNHPKLLTPVRDIIIAEGVYAAIEVKPDISNLSDDKCELKRALKQIKSVKRLKREIPILGLKILGNQNKPDYFKKIPSFIFSFKSKSGQETIDYILNQIQNDEYEIYDIPDFIITLDNGIIFFTPFLSHSMYSGINKNFKTHVAEKCFIHFQTQNESTLALFLLFLYSVQAPELQMSGHILRRYLESIPLESIVNVRNIE